MRALTIIALLASSLSATAHAELISYSGNTVADVSGFYFVGTYGDFYVYNQPVDIEIEATIDSVNQRILFDKYSVIMRAYEVTHSDSFPVGLGQSVQVDTTFYFDEVVSEIYSWGWFDLVPDTGGVFSIDWPLHPSDANTNATGTYEVVGPTESASGSFSKELSPSNANLSFRWRLDANNFPTSIELVDAHTLSWNATYAPYLVEETVDGVSIDVSIGGRYGRFQDTQLAATATVPVPSSLAVPLVAILALSRHRKGCRRQRLTCPRE